MPVTTLPEFSQEVDRLMSLRSDARWFRGMGNAAYQLTPSLFRHPNIATLAPLDLEGSLITRFRQRSIPYLNQRIEDDWELLFLMQHHAVPTRLLDWSENPYVALYFALNSCVKDPITGSYPDCCVWSLDPIAWNRAVLDDISFTGGVLVATDQQIDSHKPGISPRLFRRKPVAMYGSYNSPRIVAQRGTFVVFGSDISPMESVKAAVPTITDDVLSKLTIPGANVAGLLLSLTAIGYTDSVLFPDLDGLAREIKRAFGF